MYERIETGSVCQRTGMGFVCPWCNMYSTNSHSWKEMSVAHRHAALDTCPSVPLFFKKYKLVLKSSLT